jgi:hypothetical protein
MDKKKIIKVGLIVAGILGIGVGAIVWYKKKKSKEAGSVPSGEMIAGETSGQSSIVEKSTNQSVNTPNTEIQTTQANVAQPIVKTSAPSTAPITTTSNDSLATATPATALAWANEIVKFTGSGSTWTPQKKYDTLVNYLKNVVKTKANLNLTVNQRPTLKNELMANLSSFKDKIDAVVSGMPNA